MSKHLERDLEGLEQKILSMSALVESMICKACQSLHGSAQEVANEVFSAERVIDVREVEIEEECLKILALHQPVASDLRRVATILKINNELERIADLAVNIAERALGLSMHPEFEIPPTLERMADMAMQMAHDALDAFVQQDVEAARDVCRRDDLVDDDNREVIVRVYAIVREDPEMIEAALHFFSAARQVERIADHATNIAEDVLYLVEGEIARHRHDEIQAS